MNVFKKLELLSMIAIQLECRDISALRRCCSRLHEALGPTNTIFWKTKFHELFDPVQIPPGDRICWYSHLSKRLQKLKALKAWESDHNDDDHKDDDQKVDLQLLFTLFRELDTKNEYWLNLTITNPKWANKIKLPLSRDADEGLRVIQVFTGFSLAPPLCKVALSQLDAESFDRPRWAVLHAITAYCHSVLDEFRPCHFPWPATRRKWWEYCLGNWHGIFVALKPGTAWPGPKFWLRLDAERVEGHTLKVKGVFRDGFAVEGYIRLSEDESFVHWDLTVYDEREDEGEFHLVGYQPAPGRVVVAGITDLWDGEADEGYDHKIFSLWPAESVLYRPKQSTDERPDSIWEG